MSVQYANDQEKYDCCGSCQWYPRKMGTYAEPVAHNSRHPDTLLRALSVP